jgi:hypothetical protein
VEEAVKALKGTPLPNLLIAAGLFFILIGFVNKLGGFIEVSPEQKKLAIPIGLMILVLGLVLNFQPRQESKTDPPKLGSQWESMGEASTGEAVFVDSSSISGSGTRRSFTYRIGGDTVSATADCDSGTWFAKKYSQWQSPLSTATKDMIAYVCK